MTLSIGNYYDVIFCQSEGHGSNGKSIWEDTDLSEKPFQKDTDLRAKRTWIWGHSKFIGYGFVGRHRFEERTQI